MFSYYYGRGRHYHSELTTRDPDNQSTQDLLEKTSKISVNPAHYSVIGKKKHLV